MVLCSKKKAEMKNLFGEETGKLEVVLRGVIEGLRKRTFLAGTAWHSIWASQNLLSLADLMIKYGVDPQGEQTPQEIDG